MNKMSLLKTLVQDILAAEPGQLSDKIMETMAAFDKAEDYDACVIFVIAAIGNLDNRVSKLERK